MPRRTRYLSLGLGVLAVALLVVGRWDLSLAVGAGALLAWGMKDPARVTWAIFVVAFAVPVTINFGYPTNPSYTLLLLLFVLAVWGGVLRNGNDRWDPKLFGAVLLLPLSALLAGLLHWHGAKPIIVGIAPLLAIGALCWRVIEESRRDPRLIARIAEALTWFSVAVAIFAKYQSISGTWPIFDQLAYHWTYTSLFDPTRAAGLSGHPIIYGTFAMAMALVALILRGRYWYVPFTANLVGLVLSGTRSAWVGMFLALVLWLFYEWRKISWRGVATTVAIAVVAFAFVAVRPFPHSSTPSSSSSSSSSPNSSTPTPRSVDSVRAAGARMSDPIGSASANARFTRIGAVWDGITDDWSTVVFGHGPEANVRYLETTGIDDGQAQVFDNTYLSFWYNYGLLGLISLFLVMLGAYLRFRSLPARVLLVGLAAQVFFFDVWLWIGAVAVFLLAVAMGASGNPAWSTKPLRELVPGIPRPRTAQDVDRVTVQS
ncbi:O-antigen ligase family protein [Micromonospora sp. NPDC004704]